MFKIESKMGPMIAICAVLFSCFLGVTFFLSISDGPTMRQRDAIGGAATAQAVNVTAEAARRAVTIEAADAAERELEATRYVTHADLSPVLTRQAILNRDLETQLHLANRAALATPTAVPAPVAAQTGRASPIIAAFLIMGALGGYAVREWGKTQRARETVTVRTPYRPPAGDIMFGDE